MRLAAFLAAGAAVTVLSAQDWTGRVVYLEDNTGKRVEIARLEGESDSYSVVMNDDAFSDHFLSMRPFKCIDGADKTWCHVPYPYEIARKTDQDLVDLEYDFLFVWKGKTDYGIDMWNGVYYVLEPMGRSIVGRMHEVNMDILAVPPEGGELRPIKSKDLEVAEPDSHWLPRLIIE